MLRSIRGGLAMLVLLTPAGVCGRTLSYVAGGGGRDSDGATAVEVRMQFVQAVQVDGAGRIYFTDLGSNKVRRLPPGGVVTTVAGTGGDGFSGDGESATAATIDVPHDIALDADGNLYIADSENNRVRRVDAETGIITTLAGTGVYGYGGDGGPALAAPLAEPSGVAVDANGNVYVSDTLNHRIRRVDRLSGTITTVAGNGTTGHPVDGVLATQSALHEPVDCFLHGDDLYIVERGGNRVRRVDAFGIITTVAGTGEQGQGGDGEPATRARLNGPRDVVVDADGALYIADGLNHRVRRVDASTGIIATVAGNGVEGRTGTGGPATQARIAAPTGLFLAADGSVYIAEENNHIIRKLDAGGAPDPVDPARADFDASGTVDFADFVLLAAAYGAGAGESAFDARLDLDGSTVIDFTDFVTFAALFGRTPH